MACFVRISILLRFLTNHILLTNESFYHCAQVENNDNSANLSINKTNEKDDSNNQNKPEDGNKRKREDETEDENKNLEEPRKLNKSKGVEKAEASENLENSNHVEEFGDPLDSKNFADTGDSEDPKNSEDTDNTENIEESSDDLIRHPEDIRDNIRMLNTDLHTAEQGKTLNDKLPPSARSDNSYVNQLCKKGYKEYFDKSNTIEEGLDKVSVDMKSILSELKEELMESEESLKAMENKEQTQTEPKKNENDAESGFLSRSSKVDTNPKPHTGLTPNKDLDDLPMDPPGYTDD